MGIFKRGRPSRQEPSDKPGIYFFRNKRTKEVDYVGETKNLKRRKKQHLASKTFKKLDLEVHWFESKEADGQEYLTNTPAARELEDRPSQALSESAAWRRGTKGPMISLDENAT